MISPFFQAPRAKKATHKATQTGLSILISIHFAPKATPRGDRLQHSLATRLARLADERRLLEAQRRLQGDLRDLGTSAAKRSGERGESGSCVGGVISPVPDLGRGIYN